MVEDQKETTLFRETAVNAFSKRSYGRPIVKKPKSWFYFSVMLFFMVAIATWFLATSTYSRKEAVLGWLAPKEGLIRISVSQGGLVEQVLFEQGDNVEKGKPIFIISEEKKLISGAGSSDDLLNKLSQEKAEIELQIRLESDSNASALKNARLLLNQLKLEKIEVEEQIKQQQERLSLQHEMFNKYKILHDDGLTVSFLELQTQREMYLSQKQALASQKQRLVALEREIINTEAILIERPLNSRQTKSELKRRLIDLSNRQTQAETLGSHAIISPISGSIATLEVQPGNTVYPRQLLASLLPEDADLFAEVYIPSRAIGFIKPKQEVRVMYAAFPHQRFGAANGTVLEVSNTVLRPEEIPTSIGLQEPAYKARIKLQKQSMQGFGEIMPLRPGMALQAEIILEKRSFLQWILEPLRARRAA